MEIDETAEDVTEFETEILGITCMNGVPMGIVFFRRGKLLGAELSGDQMEKIPAYTNRRDRIVTTINAPEGMTAKVSGTRITRNYVRDFQSARETVVSYTVTCIEYRN